MRQKWDLFVELVKASFKIRYRGSVLGFVWVLMKPLMMFLVLFVVFSKLGQENYGLNSSQYAAYLLLGLIVFSFFSEGVTWGMNALMDKSDMIMKVNFNRTIAVASSIALSGINFLVNMVIFIIVAVVAKIDFNLAGTLYAVGILGILMMFVTGMSLITSIMLVKLKDLLHVTELLLQLLFYASAVFFPIEMVPEKWQFVVKINPLAVMISAVRDAIVLGEVEYLNFISAILVASLMVMGLGYVFFSKNIRKVAEFF